MCALEGLSVGDAFGERSPLHQAVLRGLLPPRALPKPPWRYTDDTEMALSIVAVLREHRGIDQERLARSFAGRYDRSRQYGAGSERLLSRLRAGEPWREAARALFDGRGSWGNGAAMRVAPLGAYFADDLDAVVEQARHSAEVTHAHPEGIAGAVAVAVAAAWAWRSRSARAVPRGRKFLDLVVPMVPEGETLAKLRRARELPPDAPVATAVALLGNGAAISAPDTVPFALWCAARRLDDYEAALWFTASGQGDVDTTCAMVGGIVALYTGVDSIPPEWRKYRESLPAWLTEGDEPRMGVIGPPA
jgi:ADP-ribosylglycohydrolase